MVPAEAPGAVAAGKAVLRMILDTGICTVFRRTDAAEPGGMPTWTYVPIWASWYGELNFETRPQWQTEGRKELRADNRIRILQNRQIRQNDIVVLEHLSSWDDRSEGAVIYQINRAWHGTDDDSPAQVTDLTLEVVEP